jgi:LemA protein
MLPLIVAATIVLLFLAAAAYLASILNHLVALKNICDNGFVQLETLLQRRYDLVLDFVESVRNSLHSDPESLENVIAARHEALARLKDAAQNLGNVAALHDWTVAEERLADELGRLRLSMENGPKFADHKHLAELAEELSSTERRVAYTRHAYNDWVMDFNTFRAAIPNAYVASFAGFTENRPLLEVMESASIPQAPVTRCS